tara:strand:- start:300 stop:686 length:387 start_codon:yes stop_codon:yes gene_type:complete
MDIIIYTSEGCEYCKNIKQLLNKADVKFIEKSVVDHQERWQQIMRLTGLGTFPTFEIGQEYYIPGRDFGNPDQFVNFLKNYVEPSKEFSSELQLMQSFKTMTYSMNQAMSKILQELNKIKEDVNKSTN